MIGIKCWCKTEHSHKNSKDKNFYYFFAHQKDDKRYKTKVEELLRHNEMLNSPRTKLTYEINDYN